MVISKGMVAIAAAAVTGLVLLPKNVNVKTVNSVEVKNKKKVDSSLIKKIERITLNKERTVHLVGPVNQVSAQYVIDELKRLDQESSSDIELLIDSPGGSVFDGAMIVSTMEGLRSKVNTVCTSICASMAFIIHQYGNTRMMVDRALLMSHPAFGGAPNGQVDNMLSFLTTISKYIHKMDEFIANRAGMSLEDYKNKIAHELWLDAEDATSAKFNDKIVFIKDLSAPTTAYGLGDKVRQIRK